MEMSISISFIPVKIRHPRESGGPVNIAYIFWIPVYTGMTVYKIMIVYEVLSSMLEIN